MIFSGNDKGNFGRRLSAGCRDKQLRRRSPYFSQPALSDTAPGGRRWHHAPLMNSASNDSSPARRIRSYVKRAGRLTAGQSRAMQELWPRWGFSAPLERLDLASIFHREAPTLLEIGFGNGEVLLATAAQHPEWNCLGRRGARTRYRPLPAGHRAGLA